MKKRVNSNLEKAKAILERVIKNEGYCPCRLDKTEDTVCPCKEYRETEKCICGLYKDYEGGNTDENNNVEG